MESDRFRKQFGATDHIYEILVDLVPIRAMGKKKMRLMGYGHPTIIGNSYIGNYFFLLMMI